MTRLPSFAVAVGILLAALLPATAHASTVRVAEHFSREERIPKAFEELVFAAAPGEANKLAVAFDGTGATITDAVPIAPGRGCVTPDPAVRTVARCTWRFTGPVAPPDVAGLEIGSITLRAALGDKDDTAAVTGQTINYQGTDHQGVDPSTDLSGGPGNDGLRGATGYAYNYLDGGTGNDLLVGGRQVGDDNTSSDTFVTGLRPDGSDTFIGNGGRYDEISYAKRRQGVRASLNGKRDDGARGERDLISSGIHMLDGSPYGDRLSGSGTVDRIEGAGGADRISGGRGDDELSAGGKAGSRIAGGAGGDSIHGSAGPDRINGGSGRDTIDGDSGADRISTRDASSDLIDCMAGRDRISIDALDTFISGFRSNRCEVVHRRGASAANPYPAGGGENIGGTTAYIEIACSDDGPRPCKGTVALFDGSRKLGSRTFNKRGFPLADVKVTIPAADAARARLANGVTLTEEVRSKDRHGHTRVRREQIRFDATS